MVRTIICADAGPLIAFGKIKQLSLLGALGKVIVPEAVWGECTKDQRRPGAKEIVSAKNNKLLEVHQNPEMNLHQHLLDFLGVGEATAIVLALELKAILLIDDKLGRETASKMNIPKVGTAGILLSAKEKGLLKQVAPCLMALKTSGYHLSDELISTVLNKADEQF